LEEILRICLGFYICYLIIFEVHSVNFSYVEDNYIQASRHEKSSIVDFNTNLTYFKF
jgi:hypothetical protein